MVDILLKKVWTIDDLCLYTGFSKAQVYLLTSQNIIPYSKPNNKTLFFEREKIEQWLLENPRKSIMQLQREASTYITSHK